MDDNRNHRQYEQDMDQESCGVKNNEAAHPQQEQQKSYNQKRTESHIASIKLAEDSIDGPQRERLSGQSSKPKCRAR